MAGMVHTTDPGCVLLWWVAELDERLTAIEHRLDRRLRTREKPLQVPRSPAHRGSSGVGGWRGLAGGGEDFTDKRVGDVVPMLTHRLDDRAHRGQKPPVLREEQHTKCANHVETSTLRGGSRRRVVTQQRRVQAFRQRDRGCFAPSERAEKLGGRWCVFEDQPCGRRDLAGPKKSGARDHDFIEDDAWRQDAVVELGQQREMTGAREVDEGPASATTVTAGCAYATLRGGRPRDSR